MLKIVGILIVVTYPSMYYSVTHNKASRNWIYCGTLYLRALFCISFLHMSEIHKFLLLENNIKQGIFLWEKYFKLVEIYFWMHI